MRLSGTVLGTALLASVLFGHQAWASHTIFDYRVDRLEIDGNVHGAHDGTPDVVNEFDDGSLAPDFYNPFGTAFETGGFLALTNPGVHVPSPFADVIDLSLAASSGNVVQGGAGDVTTTSFWAPTLPPPGQSYHVTFFVTYAGSGFQQLMGVGIANREAGLELEQHRTDLNQSTFQYQNTVIDFLPFSADDVTGQIGLRLHLDDASHLVTGSFSLDGGATWTSPFPSRLVSDLATHGAQLLLSADPEPGSGGGGTTTTTVAGTTTTSTTLVPGSCSAAGCRRTTRFDGSKLILKDRGGKGDSLTWKFRRGETTALADFGDPLGSTDYEFCLSDGTGAVLMQITVPGGQTCDGGPCWKATSKGFKFADPDRSYGGVRKMLLRPGTTPVPQVLVKGRGETLTLPPLPIQNLPLTARLRASNGECWANVFDQAGVSGNIPAQFKASGD